MTYPEPDDEEIAKIPQPIREQLLHLQWTLVDVDSRWRMIDQLYGNQDDVSLLRRASAYGYHLIYETLWEHCILSIARLMDPPKTVGKRNLTLLSLKEVVKLHADTHLFDLVSTPLDELLVLVAGCKQFRNKILAHNDFDTAFSNTNQPEVKVREINDFLSKATELINGMRNYFDVKNFCFDIVIGADASGIVKSLQALKQFRDLRNDVVRHNVSDFDMRRRLQLIRPL